MATMIGKITMRSIKVSPAKHATEKGEPIALIYGKATGIKEIVDKVRGDVFQAITGQFEAVNLEDGEVFQSGVLYLPSGIHALIENAVKQRKDETQTVDFGLQIRAVKASNPAGYSYEGVNMVKAQMVDPLDDLREQIRAGASKTIDAKTPTKTLPPGK